MKKRSLQEGCVNVSAKLKPIALGMALSTLALSSNVFSDPVFKTSGSPLPNNGEVYLTSERLVQTLVRQNAQVIFSRIQSDIAVQRISMEQGSYEAELFANLNYDDTHVQTSATDRLSSIARLNEYIFDEQNTDLVVGVKKAFSTGTEVKVSYVGQEKTNNVIPKEGNGEDTEYKTSLNIEVMQPLLQGLGSTQVQTRLKKAELEHELTLIQYEQQLMKVVFDALNLYWQLYRANEFVEIRQNALENAKKTLEDIQLRVASGREPEISIYEARSNFAKRKAALMTAVQSQTDVHNRLKTFLNLPAIEYKALVIKPQDQPKIFPYRLTSNFDDYYQWVLETWPSYRALQKNILIQSEELKAAQDEKRPRLDLRMGYTSNSLRNEYAFDPVLDNDYPSWFIGLNFTMLLQGNEKALAKEQIAQFKQQQHLVDLEATKAGLINDLKSKLAQVDTTYQELLSIQESVSMLEFVYASEFKKFELGQGRLIDLYDREDRLIIEKQRWIEGQVKYELSKVALSLSDGSLLNQYKIGLNSSPRAFGKTHPIIEVKNE